MFFVQLSLAREIAVSHKNNILNDRIFLQITGRKQIIAQPVINETTVTLCYPVRCFQTIVEFLSKKL